MSSKLKNKILLSSPHMGGLEMGFIQEAFEENWVAPLGPNVDAFEQEMVTYLQDEDLYAVAMTSGTAALHIALRLLGVGPGDEVFCSSLTFIASANPILYQGAIPVFIDSDSQTWNMSPEALERGFEESLKKNKLPKAVVVVDLFGQSADYRKLITICNKFNVPIIEDAAEALGASLDNKKCGTFGDYGILSFNGNKIMTTGGGGMLLVRDKEKAKYAHFLITQARDPAPYYLHSVVGNNYRMSNIAAGIGRGQLRVLDQRVSRRREINRLYRNELEDSGVIDFMTAPSGYFSTNWLSVGIFTKKVDPLCFVSKLAQENIEVRPIWKPMHTQPLFAKSQYYASSQNSFADLAFSNGLCLPSGSNLGNEDILRVCEAIKNIFYQE